MKSGCTLNEMPLHVQLHQRQNLHDQRLEAMISWFQSNWKMCMPVVSSGEYVQLNYMLSVNQKNVTAIQLNQTEATWRSSWLLISKKRETSGWVAILTV